MAEETVTKRLHVAGLTPGITAQDLTARFASFGTVLAVDGLGLQDGVGQPRKFAYVTLTATPEKLRRCMNLLSGTHYKGAKLRIGEAKPDWHEHWEKEHKEAVVEEGRPNKKRKMGVEGKEARDMEVVSVENVEGKPYWKLTALQHLIRPLRMRPLHPLPPPTSTLPAPKPGSSKPADKPSKRKLKALEPPNRARRVVIDPREWGAVHLTGGLLEAGDVNLPKRVVMRDGAEEGEKEREEKLKKKKKKKKQDVEMDDPPAAAEPAPTPALNPKPKKPTSTPAAPAPEGSDPLLLAITAEQSATLSLLKQMFGEGLEKADEWVDEDSELEREEEGATVGMGRNRGRRERGEEGEGGYEDARGDVRADVGAIQEAGDEGEDEDDEEEGDDQQEPSEEEEDGESEEEEGDTPTGDHTAPEPTATDELERPASSVAAQKEKQVQESLKDLFAPREETGGFTFDLDLDDLDDDPTLAPPMVPTSVPAPFVPPQRASAAYEPPDAQKSDFSSYPLFFPTWDEDGKPVENHLTLGGRKRPQTFWDAARDKGWMNGWKRETEEEARQRWEQVRGGLTQEWKKRSREARRRRKATGLAGVGEAM